MSISAMKQALEALELALNSHNVFLTTNPIQDAWQARQVEPQTRQAITALRQAIAEAEDAVAAEREACAKVCRSEADRALWNFQNDLPENNAFWNGAEQMASSCENLIKTRVSA
jgi:hypothetical protein